MSKLKIFTGDKSKGGFIETNSPTSRILSQLSVNFAQNGNPFQNVGGLRQVFSMESLDASTAQELDNEADNLNNTLNEIVTEEGGDYTEAQKEAALGGALAAADPKAFYNAEHTDVEGDVPEGDLGGRIKEAVEAYDETENKNTIALTTTYNLRAARQDDFGEAFFPTYVLGANENGVSVTMDLLSVLNDIERKTSGAGVYEFGRKNLIMALRDPSILHNDTTRCYPVYRTGVNDHLFAETAHVAAANVLLEDGTSVLTAPLKFGKVIDDYIGLCATDALLAGGAMNRTDALDPHVQLSTLYMKVGDEIFAFRNLDMSAGSDFNYVVQGKNRQVGINLTLRHLVIDEHTKKADGGASTALNAPITAKQQVRLSVDLNGTIDLETGRLVMTTSNVSVVAVYDQNGDSLDLTTGQGKNTADLFKDATMPYYDIITRRINSNRRECGQQVELHQETRRYSMPYLSPISVIRPTAESDNQDAARLDRLTTLTYIRISNDAVNELLRMVDVLKSVGPVHNFTDLYSMDILGMSRFMVTPWLHERELDVMKELQTIKSQDRITDLTSVLINAIRQQVYTAYWESGYKAASDLIYGPGGKKPVVVIGTDANIINYLMVTGDFRTLGNEFDVKLVSTNNTRMKGKIIWSFGRPDGTANDLSNPLHFGNMIWRPEIVSVLPVVGRQNTFSRELTVQPSYRHVTHLPIMGLLNVTNLPEAVVDYKVNSVKTS